MSTLMLLFIFLVSAIVTWVAGTWLTRATDAIDHRYQLGSAFGGLLILGVVTSLPEIAIAITAAVQGNYSIVIGTLIGGIAIQTAVISFFDLRMYKDRVPLTYAAASLTLVLEAVIVIMVTVVAIIGVSTPALVPTTSLSLTSVLILLVWLFGLWITYRARRGLPWQAKAIEAIPGRGHRERRQQVNHHAFIESSSTHLFTVFALSSIATLIAGYGLATTGGELASVLGINEGLFAATFIALAGALPNISTGFSSIDIGDYQLAMSDIFGGNAFMPALFIICDLISGGSILSYATSNDIWFAALGILLTAVYIIGLIVRPKKQLLGMGIDSLVVIPLYIVGILLIANK